MRSRILLVLFLFLLFPFTTGYGLWACRGGSSERLLPSSTLRVYLESKPASLNPVSTIDLHASLVRSCVFLPLAEVLPDGTLIPILLEEIPPLDSSRWVWRLRPEIRWADGKPLSGHDVVFTLRLLANPYVEGIPMKDYIRVYVDAYVDPEDSLRVMVILHPILSLSLRKILMHSLYPVPEHIYDPERWHRRVPSLQALLNGQVDSALNVQLRKVAERWKSQRETPEYLTGSGPYRLLTVEPGRIRLQRLSHWWGDDLTEEVRFSIPFLRAYPREIHFEIIPDIPTLLHALREERVDVAHLKDPSLFMELQMDPQIRAHYEFIDTPSPNIELLTFRVQHPIFSDVRVRRAIAYLVPWDRILQQVLLNYAERMYSVVFPQLSAIYNDTLTPYPYDPARARQLLQQAGWRDINQDGILERIQGGNDTLVFRAELIFNSENVIRQQVALMLQEEARRAGMILDVKPLPWKEYLDRLNRGEFALALEGYWFSRFVEPSLRFLYHSESPSNRSGYSSPEIDALIEELERGLSGAQRIDLWKRAQAMLYRDLPHLYLYMLRGMYVIHRRVKEYLIISGVPPFHAPSFQLREPSEKEGEPSGS